MPHPAFRAPRGASIMSTGLVALCLFPVLGLALGLAACRTPGPDGAGLPPELRALAAGQEIRAWQAEHPGLGSPLVNGQELTFFYTNAGAEWQADRLWLVGEFNGWSETHELKRVGQGPLFCLSLRIPQADGQAYGLQIQSKQERWVMRDPLNPSIKYQNPLRSAIALPGGAKGHIELHPQWQPASGIARRDIWVYLPPGYDPAGGRRYPVLYFQDGQQVWDSQAAANGGWKGDSAVEALVASGEIEPCILVGIRNSAQRSAEYIGYSAYWGRPERTDPAVKAAGERASAAYRDFVCDELKPFIDRRYRTKSGRMDTAIAGSSFGASAALYIAFSRPELFGKVGAFSGGNYDPDDKTRADRSFYQPYPWLAANLLRHGLGTRVYLDCGGSEVDAIFLPRTQEMIISLELMGYEQGKDLLAVLDRRAGHNEGAWAARLPGCLRYFFGRGTAAD